MRSQEQSTEQLAKLRQRIDALDEQIQELIRQRTLYVAEVAKVKQQTGGAIEYYRPEREAQLLRRIKARNQGPLSDTSVARLFREIISAGMVLEQTLVIAYPQSGASDTLKAVYRHFGQSVHTLAVTDNDAVFAATSANKADFGLVPADHHCAELFLEYPLLICGEVILAQRFVVIGKQAISPSGEDKTTLLVTATGRQSYFLDLEGHQDEPATAARIKEQQKLADDCRCLGSYPSNVL